MIFQHKDIMFTKAAELCRISAGQIFQLIPCPAPDITLKLDQVKNIWQKGMQQQHFLKGSKYVIIKEFIHLYLYNYPNCLYFLRQIVESDSETRSGKN